MGFNSGFKGLKLKTQYHQYVSTLCGLSSGRMFVQVYSLRIFSMVMSNEESKHVADIVWRLCDRASWWISYIKPTRCTNSSNLFSEWNSTCFGQFLCPSSGVFYWTHSSGICHTDLLTACEQDQDGAAVPFWSCSQAVTKPVWRIPLLCVQWKTPDDGQRNYPKHAEFHSENKFEKLVHLASLFIKNWKYCVLSFKCRLPLTWCAFGWFL